MYKKALSSIFVLCATLIMSACSDTNSPQLGKHFSQLPSDLSTFELSPITEVFSLTCGHCRNMEQYLPEIEKLTNQKIEKIHVTFNQSAHVSAMFYYTAEMQLNAQPDHKMLDNLFAAIQKRDISDEERQIMMEKVYTERGLISPYKLTKAQSAKMLKYVAKADKFTTAAEINSVPSFIIKGKYLLNTDEHKDIQELADTINFILSDSNL